MRAALLAVGSELLGADRLDTNSLKVTALLRRYGVEVGWKGIVGDDELAIAAEMRRLLDAFDLVVVGGGLGPTADDVTREAAARALGVPLERRPELEEAQRAWFARLGRTLVSSNLRQADVPAGATVLENSWGTAPGIRADEPGPHGSRSIFLLPGVPRELERMLERHLEPWLAAQGAGVEVETRTLRVACLPESWVEELIRPAYATHGRENITVLAAVGDILVRPTARGPAEARRERLARMTADLAALLGDAVYAEEEARTLEVVVNDLLRERGLTLATAESCTGGLIAERITAVAGSSEVFLGGVVAYSNALKRSFLDVPATVLEADGAVSEATAVAMAEGARRRTGADLAIAVTGIAGPGGGSDEKPVGTVHLALVGPAEGPFAGVTHRRVRFPGDRDYVRRLTAQLALDLVRRRLLGLRPAPEMSPRVGTVPNPAPAAAAGPRP